MSQHYLLNLNVPLLFVVFLEICAKNDTRDLFWFRLIHYFYLISNNFDFLEFAMLTLVPYEKNLINWQMLTKNEIEYLSKYYKLIEKRIMPHLSIQAKNWLQTQLRLVF